MITTNGSVRVSWRIPTWATDANSAASTPTRATGWKTPIPGFRISTMPAKPTVTGHQRRRGNGSPSHAASTNGMNRGSE